MPTDIHRTNETKTTRPDTCTHLRRTQTWSYLRIWRTLRQHSPQHHHPQHHLQDPQTNKWHTTTTHRGSLRHPNKIPTTKPTRQTPWNGFPHLTLTTYSTDNTPVTIHSADNTLNWQHTPLTTHSTDKTLYRQHALLLTALSPELANSICTLATICNLLSLMYIATPEQPASYLFITRTSHLNHTRPQNAPHTTHKFRVLLLNARTQPSFDQTDDGVDAETSLSLSLCISFSLLRPYTFSHAHLWSLKLSLKMRVSSNELFSTLKHTITVLDWKLNIMFTFVWSMFDRKMKESREEFKMRALCVFMLNGKSQTTDRSLPFTGRLAWICCRREPCFEGHFTCYGKILSSDCAKFGFVWRLSS